MDLKTFFTENPRGALAYSGGTDSSLLVWAAMEYGKDWHAYYVHSAFQPAFELTTPGKSPSNAACLLPSSKEISCSIRKLSPIRQTALLLQAPGLFHDSASGRGRWLYAFD